MALEPNRAWSQHDQAPAAHLRLVASSRDTSRLEVSTRVLDPLTVAVRLVGELDAASAHMLASLADCEAGRGRRTLRLDLSGLSFCDCAGLGVIVESHNRLLAEAGMLVVTGLRPQLRRLLAITGLDEVLLVADAHADPARPRLNQRILTVPL